MSCEAIHDAAGYTVASVGNMRRIGDDRAVKAWSPHTGEEYSATPGDYWDAPDSEVLKDSEDEPMILVREVCTMHDALTDKPFS